MANKRVQYVSGVTSGDYMSNKIFGYNFKITSVFYFTSEIFTSVSFHV